MIALGVDIGGTKIAVGQVDEQGRLITSEQFPTGAKLGFAHSWEQVLSAIETCLHPSVRAIGVAAPGPLNPVTGVVVNPPNLPGWREIPLRRQLEERFGLPVVLENDANAAAVAEFRFGASQGCKSAVFLCIGTGIGSGILVDGKLLHGRNGMAGEAGHITIDYQHQEACPCGNRGCAEQLASGPAMVGRARRLLANTYHSRLAEPITPASIMEHAKHGDEISVRVVEETIRAIAALIGNLITLFDPEIVVIGGGVAEIGAPLFSGIRQQLAGRTMNPLVASVAVVPAAFRIHAGVVGAATLALEKAMPV